MNRKATPDVLDALMSGAVKKESNKAINIEPHKAVEQPSGKAVKRESNKAIKQAHFEGMEPVDALEEKPVEKEKATFNLSKKVLSDLEDCWMEIRKMRGDKKVSKTDIVEQAVEDALNEFHLKKQLSKFYRKLESNKAIKR